VRALLKWQVLYLPIRIIKGIVLNMNSPYVFIVDKQVAFYYWAQAITGWYIPPGEDKLYEYYLSFLKNLPIDCQQSIDSIKNELQSAENARNILVELYQKNTSSNEAIAIAKHAQILLSYFDALWIKAEPELNIWKSSLENYDYTDISREVKQIAYFLQYQATNLESQPIIVYMLPNYVTQSVSGHVLRNSDFVLLHPPSSIDDESIRQTLTIVIHETIHLFDFSSPNIETVLKQAFDIYNEKLGRAPEGYSWKSIASEVLAYCFANNITGGYIRQSLYDKKAPTTQDFEIAYNKLLASGNIKTSHQLAWIGLKILPDINNSLSSREQFNNDTAEIIFKNIFDIYS
jgi:hypothetical protein